MPDSFNKFRAQFSKPGLQQRWVILLQDTLSIEEMARLCGCSERTIRDWRREKFLMDYDGLVILCNTANHPLPRVKKVPRYAHASRAGKKGAQKVLQKYGRVPIEESFRKKKWKEWWNKTGYKETKITRAKQVSFPRKSARLAEFVGVMLGDGGLSKYQAKVTLHAVNDKAYGLFVSKLIQDLFQVPVAVRQKKQCLATDYVVSRKELVAFCTKKLGLVQGNKIHQQVAIPRWIIENDTYARACVRGLIDTDGSVFVHRYRVNGKQYAYKKLAFTSASKPLRDDVVSIFQAHNIRTVSNGRNVRIENQKDMSTYFERFGSHNPKHLKRYVSSSMMR